MNEQPAGPPGLEVRQLRVYYDPATGEVLYVHQLASAPADPLDPERVDAEMNAFEKALRHRTANLAYLVVDADELSEFGDGVAVDIQRKALVEPGT